MEDSALETQQRAVSRVLAAIEAIKRGEMVVMMDDEDRENEGDLVFAADHVSPEKINFMAREARGLICLTLASDIVDRLDLPLMTDRTKSRASMGTAFTVSIEAKTGVTTGISAADRAHTIRVAIDSRTSADDLVVPGHIFPLRALDGGVLMRAGHTEGSVDLARLAGLKSAGVVCEIMNDDGTMARRPELEAFAHRHRLHLVTIEDLITFRLMQDSLIELLGQGPIKTPWGEFPARLYRSLIDNACHLAVHSHEINRDEVVEVRVQRQDPLCDIFGTVSGGSRLRIDYGMNLLQEGKNAVFLYLSAGQDAPAIADSFRRLQSAGGKDPRASAAAGPMSMDSRQLGVGAQILKALGVEKMRLHLNQAASLKGLGGFGLEVTDVKMMDLKEPQG